MDCIICYENLNDKLLVLSCCNNIIHQKCLYLCNNINCVECKSNIYFTLDVKYKDILYNLNNNKITFNDIYLLIDDTTKLNIDIFIRSLYTINIINYIDNEYIVKMYLKVNDINKYIDNNCNTLLHICNNEDIVDILNNNKINILIKNKDGYNALHNAIIKQKKNILKLINIGIDVNIKTDNNISSLFLALHTNNNDIIKLILKYTNDITCFFKYPQYSVLHYSIDNNNNVICDILLDNNIVKNILKCKYIINLFKLAIQNNNIYIIEKLIKNNYTNIEKSQNFVSYEIANIISCNISVSYHIFKKLCMLITNVNECMIFTIKNDTPLLFKKKLLLLIKINKKINFNILLMHAYEINNLKTINLVKSYNQ